MSQPAMCILIMHCYCDAWQSGHICHTKWLALESIIVNWSAKSIDCKTIWKKSNSHKRAKAVVSGAKTQ